MKLDKKLKFGGQVSAIFLKLLNKQLLQNRNLFLPYGYEVEFIYLNVC